MANYLAQRILDGALEAQATLIKYPQLKEEVRTYLQANGGASLLTMGS